MGKRLSASQHGETVGLDDERLAIVLGHDIKDDTRHEQQQPGDDKHDRSDQRGESGHHAGVPEVHRHRAAQHDANDAEDAADAAEEWERLVFADHAENGAHHLDTVAHSIELADRPLGAIPILNRHLIKAEVVVQRVDGHLGFDLEAARQHRIGLDEGERESPVTGHNVGDIGVEQAVDGTANQTVAEVVEGPLVLLEVRGAQSVADHHVVAFEDFVHHGRRGVGGIRIITVGHDIHVSIDVFEHGANHVALALARLLADDRAFARRYLGGAVGGVVVVYVHVGIGQRRFEVAHHLADGDFLVIARKKHRNGNVRILKHTSYYSFCAADFGFCMSLSHSCPLCRMKRGR